MEEKRKYTISDEVKQNVGRPIQPFNKPFKQLTEEEKIEYMKIRREKEKNNTYKYRDKNREEYNKYMRELNKKNKKSDKPKGRPRKNKEIPISTNEEIIINSLIVKKLENLEIN